MPNENDLFAALGKVRELDWEQHPAVQHYLTAGDASNRCPISGDPQWRQVQLICLLLEDLRAGPVAPAATTQSQLPGSSSSTLDDANSLKAGAFSVAQRKILADAFDFLVGYAVRPNLVPAIWRSSQKVPPTEARVALKQHRRLVASVGLLLHFADEPQFKSILYSKHLVDVFVALFQLCYAPIRKVDGLEEVSQKSNATDAAAAAGLLALLAHGLETCDPDQRVVTPAQVTAEMQSDRLTLLPKLDHLLGSLFQPAVIKCLVEILSHKNQAWLRRVCSTKLSAALLSTNGLAHVLIAVSEFFDSDVSDWKQVENFALLVACCPSFVDQATYLSNIGEQLHKIMFICKEPVQFRLLVAVFNSLLAVNPASAVEHVFSVCFSSFVDILRGRGIVSSNELGRHLAFVASALNVLPHDAVLLEAFAMFMPVYVKVVVSGRAVSAMAKSASELVGALVDKLEDGASLMLAVLDPDDERFRLPSNVTATFADDGGIQLSADTEHCDDQADLDAYVGFVRELCLSRPKFGAKLFLVLLQRFDDFKSELPTDENGFFRLLVVSSLASVEALAQEVLVDDLELTAEFALVNLERSLTKQPCPMGNDSDDDDTLILTLGMLETLASNGDKLSATALGRLKLAAHHLKSVSGHLATRCADLSKAIDELEEMRGIKTYDTKKAQPLASWKFAPIATKVLLDVDWQIVREAAAESAAEAEDWNEPTLDELVKRAIQRNRKQASVSVYGNISDYRHVKEQLLNPDIATRGHGFIQLRKLLSSRDADALRDLDAISELCKNGMEEGDSYVYIGAVECFAQLVQTNTDKFLPILVDRLLDASNKDNRVRVLLAESLARCIPFFGDMMPVYSARLIEVLLACCADDSEDLMRVFGCSLLGEVVARLSNVGRIFRQTLNVLVALMTTDASEVVRWAAAQGLATIFKNMDKATLARDYGGEVRDVHRIIKCLYASSDDQRLKLQLQETLLALGDLAKYLIGAQPDEGREAESPLKNSKLNIR